MENTTIRAILGKNIKLFRNQRGWSQTDLAERAHISTNYMCDIETCKKWPYPETLSNIAKGLKVEVYELFKPETAPPRATAETLARYNEDAVRMIKKSYDILETSLAGLLEKYIV